MIPPMSSTTAKAVRNIFKLNGTFFPNKERTPRENAMSVAIGIAAPLAAAPAGLNSKNRSTGIIIPPQAATTGSMAFRGEESSPTRTSRLISKPTEKKKTAIKASLIKARKLMLLPWLWKRLKLPNWSTTSWANKEL